MTQDAIATTTSTLKQQISAVEDRLKKCSNEDISKFLKSLTAAGFALTNGISLNMAIEVYAYALEDLSKYAINTVTRKLIRGEYEDTRPFIPSPPEFASLVRREMASLHDDLADLRLRQASIDSSKQMQGRVKTEEEKARVRAMIAKFHAERQADEAMHTAEPLTEERAEYWRKIMALKDAPEKNEDFNSFRSHIEKYVKAADEKRMEQQ